MHLSRMKKLHVNIISTYNYCKLRVSGVTGIDTPHRIFEIKHFHKNISLFAKHCFFSIKSIIQKDYAFHKVCELTKILRQMYKSKRIGI